MARAIGKGLKGQWLKDWEQESLAAEGNAYEPMEMDIKYKLLYLI